MRSLVRRSGAAGANRSLRWNSPFLRPPKANGGVLIGLGSDNCGRSNQIIAPQPATVTINGHFPPHCLLPQIAHAGDVVRFRFDLRQSAQQQGGQNRNDSYGHQQLNEREAKTVTVGCRGHKARYQQEEERE